MTSRPEYPQVRELLYLQLVFIQSTAFLLSPMLMTNGKRGVVLNVRITSPQWTGKR